MPTVSHILPVVAFMLLGSNAGVDTFSRWEPDEMPNGRTGRKTLMLLPLYVIILVVKPLVVR